MKANVLLVFTFVKRFENSLTHNMKFGSQRTVIRETTAGMEFM